ncbi:MAG: TatD family hydrolase [Bdellovibrionota bacterium]
MHYVDVHTHLTHEKFINDIDQIIENAANKGLGAIVCNGLEPISNRQILTLAQEYKIVLPALGIYPINGIHHLIPKDSEIAPKPFDVADEIKFIKEQAEAKKIIAVGECGVDGYWVGKETFPEQERVLEQLIEIAVENTIPIIIHNRKLEKRSIEILRHNQVKKVNFHCFSGKVKLALDAAEFEDWCFSIPANARKNEGFTQLLKKLPPEKILTETDAPYLAPIRGERNQPANVANTIIYLAELRKWSLEESKNLVWQNFCRLFEYGSNSSPPKKSCP